MDTRRITSIAVFTTLIIIGGLISVPVPFTAVEVSLQVVFVLAAGMLLGGRDGALAVLVYIVMGLIGLPVFTQGGGAAYIFKPSFGYLIGFPVGAAAVGAICAHGKKRTARRAFAAALVGMIPIYVIGIAYQILILRFYVGSDWGAALATVPAVAVMAVKDGALVGLVSTAYPAISKAVRRSARGKRAAADREMNVG